jgi:hypothetical protein
MSARPVPAAPAAPSAPAVAIAGDRPLGWRGWVAVGACVLAANVALLHHALRGPAPVTVRGTSFHDDFQRAELGDDYFTTGMHWRIAEGELWAPEAKNNALWLKMRLPRDVAIDFDARSETGSGSRPGDIKFEIFGNGRDHASGYVCVFGGWGNTTSVIARLDEHGANLDSASPDELAAGRVRKERRDRRVEINRKYHMRVERRGRQLRWLIDGELFMDFDDPRPLEGPGHDRFGFSGWEADLFFDNLGVTPL